jgi:hypothetical protein
MLYTIAVVLNTDSTSARSTVCQYSTWFLFTVEVLADTFIDALLLV